MRKFLYNNPLQLEPVPSYRYFGQLRRSSDGFLEFRSEVYGWRAATLYSLQCMRLTHTIQHFVSYFTPNNVSVSGRDFDFYDLYRSKLRDFYQNYYRIFSILHRESIIWDFACDNSFLDRFERMNFVSLSYNSKLTLDILIVVLNQIMVWRSGMSDLSDSELFELKFFLKKHPKYYLLTDVYPDMFKSSKDLFD